MALHAHVQPLPAERAWCLKVNTQDVDAHAQAQPLWHQHYEQLSGGRFEGALHHVQLPGVRLVREDSNQALRQRGDLGRGAYGFAMPLQMQGTAIFNGQRVQGNAVMVGSGDELDLVTPQGFSLVGAVVDAQLLLPLWERMYQRPPSAWMQAQLVVPARSAAAVGLRQLHLRALQALSDPQGAALDEAGQLQWRDALLMEWFEALPERVDARELPTVAARKRLVDKACEWMLSHTEEPVSMLEVCRRVGTSRRKLNYCFQDVLGISPLKYLRAVRLNGLRRELRRGVSTSVQQAAQRWGFWHLGQLARDYKLQFGELPSQTLAKRAPP